MGIYAEFIGLPISLNSDVDVRCSAEVAIVDLTSHRGEPSVVFKRYPSRKCTVTGRIYLPLAGRYSAHYRIVNRTPLRMKWAEVFHVGSVLWGACGVAGTCEPQD